MHRPIVLIQPDQYHMIVQVRRQVGAEDTIKPIQPVGAGHQPPQGPLRAAQSFSHRRDGTGSLTRRRCLDGGGRMERAASVDPAAAPAVAGAAGRERGSRLFWQAGQRWARPA
ncbi:hypothetical protein [Candidatus Competibacter phosphatis]|uniref:hypothetical protein n=1 Tax=Candidatus Competibacter phosphatis TaxID=221280 RepID=UPI001FE46C43|nr:hypothetical protein [Candidatus Competibacter phosphatis]